MKRRDAGLLLQGSLAHLSTPDLVQVLAVARKSGAIHFRAPADAGTLWIREGTIVDAQTDRLHRREAALEILSWTEGTFEVVFREVERADTIEEPTSTLLMTAMIAADEARANPALATQVPPATRRGFHPAWLLGALGIGFAVAFLKLGGEPNRARADVRRADRASAEPVTSAPVFAASPATPPEPEPLAHRTLVVEAWPDDAQVFVAGRLRASKTPARIGLGRLTGVVAVRVTRDGFRDWVTEIGPSQGWNVIDDEVVRVVRARMREVPATVVATAPEAAQATAPEAALQVEP